MKIPNPRLFSIGQSIARALDRKFFRFSVGGMNDVAGTFDISQQSGSRVILISFYRNQGSPTHVCRSHARQVHSVPQTPRDFQPCHSHRR
jgi:hypothetical protein